MISTFPYAAYATGRQIARFPLLILLTASPLGLVTVHQVFAVETWMVDARLQLNGGSIGWSTSTSEGRILAAGTGAGYLYERSGGVWRQTAVLTASDQHPSDDFPTWVDVCGDRAIAGSWKDDDLGPNSGSAYIYEYNGSVWNEAAKITASDGSEYDNFGKQVGIYGDWAIVSCQRHDGEGYDFDIGAAYLYERTESGWVESTILVGSDSQAGDLFGSQVAIHDDHAIVAAQWDDDIGFNAGSAFLFSRSGANWDETGKATPGDGGRAWGYAVDIFAETAVIGLSSYDGGRGAAFVYKWNGHDWDFAQMLRPSDGSANDFFGTSVQMSNDRIVIGAPYHDLDVGNDLGAVYVFEPSDSGWFEAAKLSVPDAVDYGGYGLGYNVSVGGDYVVAAALFNGGHSGDVYVFKSMRLAADFDGDEDVDGDDFLTWQGGYGMSTGAQKSDGDYDDDGDVDGDDFLGWQAEFGSGSGSVHVVVPEPASVALLIAAIVGAVCLVRDFEAMT